MLIISDFHDYYDGIMKQGVDKNIVYNRKLKEIELTSDKDLKYPFNSTIDYTSYRHHYKLPSYLNISMFNIIFCGRIYPGIRFSFGVGEYNNIYCYNTREVINLIKNNNIDIRNVFNRLNFNRVYRYFKRDKDPLNDLKKECDYYFREFGSNKYMSDLINDRIIVCLFERRDLKCYHVINPKLMDYQFYRIFDSYSAFQELSMYIGGVLPKETREPMEISDRDMMAKKGFDERSFKMDSPGKKRKRRAR